METKLDVIMDIVYWITFEVLPPLKVMHALQEFLGLIEEIFFYVGHYYIQRHVCDNN